MELTGLHGTGSDSFQDDELWELISTERRWDTMEYDVNETYAKAIFMMTFRRRPLYDIFNLMIPCFLMSLICTLVFLMPPDTREKLPLATTILLSQIVLMLLLYTRMPESADTIPIICMQ